jgi:ceramide glucosyltransferase
VGVMTIIVAILSLIATAGIAHLLVGYLAVRRFNHRRAACREDCPPVSVLKPLYGDEPLLYEALRSFCRQDYPHYQIVFGVRDPLDPALAAVRRLQQELPATDITVVIDGTLHGANRKISNLINMAQAAKYDHYVISDSDMHVTPCYLRAVMGAFSGPKIGLVTTLYTGQPIFETVVSDLAVSHLNHLFLPSALVGMWLGRRSDCFGATMALSRAMLDEIGGWAMLSHQLADDFVLGREVQAHGFAVALAPVLPGTTIAEASFQHLFSHELRWARTIRAMVPVGFAASLIQYPIAFALLACLAAGAAHMQVQAVLLLLAVAIIARIVAARAIDYRLGLKNVPLWLMPVRDILSFCIVLASFCGRKIEWRGHAMHVQAGGTVVLHEPVLENIGHGD